MSGRRRDRADRGKRGKTAPRDRGRKQGKSARRPPKKGKTAPARPPASGLTLASLEAGPGLTLYTSSAAIAEQEQRWRRGRWDKGQHRKSDAAAVTVDGAAARFRVRSVRCGKSRCRMCPHRTYVYVVWRGADGKPQERYVGRVDDPRLRERVVAAFTAAPRGG